MNIDPSKSADQNILDLITSENPDHVFTLDKVDVGEVSAVTGVDYNSVVTVTAKPNAGFSGSKEVYFTRVTPSQASIVPAYPIRFDAGDTHATMKERICAQLGLIPDEVVLGTNDVFDLPDRSNITRSVSVTPKHGSKLYIGPTHSVNIRLSEYVLENLGSMFSTTGWVEDATRGWYNNNYGWGTAHPINGIPAEVLSNSKELRGTFTGYFNTPSGSMSQSFVSVITNSRSVQMGTSDAWDLSTSGQDVMYGNGGVARVYSNVLDYDLVMPFAESETISSVSAFSNKYESYPVSLRGFKNLRFILRTVG